MLAFIIGDHQSLATELLTSMTGWVGALAQLYSATNRWKGKKAVAATGGESFSRLSNYVIPR